MKKTSYGAPKLTIQLIDASTTNGSHCVSTVSFGPGISGNPDYPTCEEFDLGPEDPFSVRAMPASISRGGASFYEDLNNCDCYYSSGGEGFFTS